MIITLFILNIVFIVALWHMDLNHNLDRLGEKKTRGWLSITPEQGYRYSEYVLLLSLLLMDVLFLLIS